MRWAGYINENELRKAVAVLQEPDEVFEVRAIGTAKKDILSGYFRDADTLLKALDSIDLRNRNIYITLGKVKSECFSRSQSEHFLKSPQTSSDTDIVSYRWLFVDLDPVRPAGISSTDEELTKAKQLAKTVYMFLQGLGFEEPVKALSGNGCHLLYRISILNNKENTKLIERCLKVLAAIFDTDAVKIDTTNYNPSRICKLHGTLAQKGTSTKDRPHRMSSIFSVPEEVKPTSKVFLEKLCAELPEEPERKSYSRDQYGGQEFNLIDFMDEHGIRYEETDGDRSKIFRLDECPFDPSHKDGDAKIFWYPNGAIAFKCHHNSCRQYRWQDVRLKFDPDAYSHGQDDARIDEGWKQHNRDKQQSEIPYTELTDESKMFRTARQIFEDPEPEAEYIRTGITVIDTRLKGGLQKQLVTCISGVRASGKTTLIGQIINNAVNDGHNVVCYSGELNNKKYLRWLMRQAAGKNNVEVTASNTRILPDAEQRILDWYAEYFWLYDNKFGNKFDMIERYLRVELKEKKADLCVVDNLMALDLSTYDRDKYEAQTKFVWALKNLAEITNTHIIFVAHPRKASGFIRLNDISGSGNIANIIDNAFLVHRHNRDFENGYKETFGVESRRDGIPERATNIIDIAKDREEGTQDVYVPLYFEEATKRLRNSEDEFLQYTWERKMIAAEEITPIDDNAPIPF